MLAKVRRKPLETRHSVLLEKAFAELKRFDLEHELTSKAHLLAEKDELSVNYPLSDAGRTLAYYAPVHALFNRFVGRPHERRVLHLAGSTGVYARFLQEKGAHPVVMDISHGELKVAKQLGNRLVVRANAKLMGKRIMPRSLPFADKSFDAFISDHFLFSGYGEFDEGSWGNNRQSNAALKELHRILRTRGIGILHRVSKDFVKKITSVASKMGFTIIASEGVADDAFKKSIVLQKLAKKL